MENLQKLIEELPPDLKQEVADFIQYLLSKRTVKKGRKLRQDWGEDWRNTADNIMPWSYKRRPWNGGATKACISLTPISGWRDCLIRINPLRLRNFSIFFPLESYGLPISLSILFPSFC
jgi:hypothetical protein